MPTYNNNYNYIIIILDQYYLLKYNLYNMNIE